MIWRGGSALRAMLGGAVVALVILFVGGQGLGGTALRAAAQGGPGNSDPADLAVSMAASPTLVFPGRPVTFTVTLTNNGPDPTTGVTVQDSLPPGLTFVSASATQGSYDPATGLWTVGSLADSATVALTLVADVEATGTLTDTAFVSHSDQPDPNPTNNSAIASILVGQVRSPSPADVGITKTVDNPNPAVGEVVTFTIIMTNHGPDKSTGTQGQDTLPAGLTFVSSSGDGDYDPGNGKWTGNLNMDAGESHSLRIKALVTSDGCFTNTATVIHQAENDPNPDNDSASVTVCAQPAPGENADLAVTKSVDNARPNVGDTVTFNVGVHNNGPGRATGVSVADALPTGLSFVSATPSQGSFDSTNDAWTVGTLASGSAATLSLVAKVISPTTQTNTASISTSDVEDPDPSNDRASATVTPQQADVAVGKGVSDATPNVGDTIQYNVVAGNFGPDAATNVTVIDLLPAGLTFISATPTQGTYNSATGLWTIGAIAAGAGPSLTITARVVSSDPVTNTAHVSHSDQFDPDLGNNTASVTITPQQSDLQVTKTVDDPTPNVGDTVTFTVTVTNSGPDSATTVAVTDPLPAGLTFVSATPSTGSYNSTTGLWIVGAVAVGTPETLAISATVNSPDAQVNTASIEHADQFDPDQQNNTDSATVTPQQADLIVLKRVDNPTPNVGQTITYTVRVLNGGPDTATGVTLLDVLPPQVSFQSATATEGSYDSVTGIWTVGTVLAGVAQSQTLTIKALVVDPSPTANTASISHADQFDPDTSNNSDTASVDPLQADLVLTKTVNDPTPNVGDTVTFSVDVFDNGSADATGVTASDPLPSGLTFVSADASQGSYNSNTGIWTVGDVDAGTSASLTLAARVESPNAVTNTATVTGDQSDPDPGNNTDSATLTPEQANLAVAKVVSDRTPNVGDTITFGVVVGNRGPDPATSVALTDRLPSGLTFVAAAPSQGAYNSATGVWTVGTLPAGTLEILVIRARVISPDPRTNTVSVTHSDQFDPNPNNNSASVTETPQQADVAVTKTVDNPFPNVGDTVTFTVTVTNHGPDDATAVTVTDPLTAGFTLVAATPDQGSYNAKTGLWNVGYLTDGQSSHLAIAALVAPDAKTNIASVAHSDQFDPDHSNNTASLAIDPLQADLAIAKTVSNTHPSVGDDVVFTVVDTNKGPNTATDVTVLDPLPPGLTFVAANPSQGTYTASLGLWTVGTAKPGTQQTLRVTVRVASEGTHTNTGSVAHSDQFDPDLSNNSSSAIVTASTTATPTSTTTTTTAAATAQTPPPKTSSTLPITGAALARLLLPAVTMIAIGLILLASLGKRRRWPPRHRARSQPDRS